MFVLDHTIMLHNLEVSGVEKNLCKNSKCKCYVLGGNWARMEGPQNIFVVVLSWSSYLLKTVPSWRRNILKIFSTVPSLSLDYTFKEIIQKNSKFWWFIVLNGPKNQTLFYVLLEQKLCDSLKIYSSYCQILLHVY